MPNFSHLTYPARPGLNLSGGTIPAVER